MAATPKGPHEIFDCERVGAWLESYLSGQIPPPEARGMRLHVHGCAACRARILARDPVQIFSTLADEERGEEFWTGFWPAVRADIHAAEAERRSPFGWLRRPALAWGAAVAMLVLAALALVRPWGGWDRPGAADAATPDAWNEILPATGEIASAGPSAPTVEDVLSPSARVLSMKVYGQDRAVTEVVLIVDEEIDL